MVRIVCPYKDIECTNLLCTSGCQFAINTARAVSALPEQEADLALIDALLAARRPKAEERTEPEARHHELVKAVEDVLRAPYHYDKWMRNVCRWCASPSELGCGPQCEIERLRSALSNMGEGA